MKHLNEEKYQRRKSRRITAGILIICFGFAIAATLAGIGINEIRENNRRHSPENRSAVYEQLRQEETRLLLLKQELEAKLGTESSGSQANDVFQQAADMMNDMLAGTPMDGMMDSMMGGMSGGMTGGAIYGSDEETLDAINAVLRGFTSGYENHAVVGEYCRLSEEYREISNDFNRKIAGNRAVPYFMIAFFVMAFTAMIGGRIIAVARLRERAAYVMQGAIPLVKEGAESITPTIIGVREELSRSRARMAAENADYYAEAVGKVAKEVSRNIKDGM